MEEKLSEKSIILSDGREVIVRKGKGRDVQEAFKVAGSDQSKLISAMMARLVTVAGFQLVYEDLMEMDAEDYLAIMQVWSELNFTATTLEEKSSPVI